MAITSFYWWWSCIFALVCFAHAIWTREWINRITGSLQLHPFWYAICPHIYHLLLEVFPPEKPTNQPNAILDESACPQLLHQYIQYLHVHKSKTNLITRYLDYQITMPASAYLVWLSWNVHHTSIFGAQTVIAESSHLELVQKLHCVGKLCSL